MSGVTVVFPGHAFSTIDVATGLCAGLRASGVAVHEYPLHTTLETMEVLVGAAKAQGAPDGEVPDPRLLAVAGIPGFVMAKQTPWVIVVHGLLVPPSIPATLRRGGYRTAVLLTESPYQMDEERLTAAAYDVAFTTERLAVAALRHPAAYHLPHAFNPAVHTPDGPRAAPCDVFFCGTRYPERDALLSGVDWSGIDVCDRSLTYTLAPGAPMPEPLDNAAVAAHYRSARISINMHRQIVHPAGDAVIAPGSAASLNPRAYEIPACGGFMVSDTRADLDAVFAGSVPVYSDSASLEGMLRYYLAHPAERDALAARQQCLVQSHTWTARASDVLGILAAHSRRAAA